MNPLNTKLEKLLFLVAILALITTYLANFRPILPPIFNGTLLGDFLTSNSVSNLANGISCSLVAAYIFYLLNDLIPRKIKERKNLEQLNSILIALFYTYDKGNIFGHEIELTSFPKHVLTKDWLKTIKQRKHNFLNFKCLVETSHSRLSIFTQYLDTAAYISHDHSNSWLSIIDKVRLLSEFYEKLPQIDKQDVAPLISGNDDHSHQKFMENVIDRFNQLIDVTNEWIELNS